MNSFCPSATHDLRRSLPSTNLRPLVRERGKPAYTRAAKTPCVAVIENPRSGFNSRHSGDLQQLCEKEHLSYRAARTPEEMKSSIIALLAQEPDILAVSGGDGTVSAILGAMQQAGEIAARPVLALLQGGSTNMIHRELGLPGSPKQALQNLLRSIQTDVPEDRIRWRSPLGVRIHGESKEDVGFFFAAGAMPRVLRACQNMAAKGIARGIVVEILGLAGAFFSLLFQDAAKVGLLCPETIHWKSGEIASIRQWQGGKRFFVYLTSLNRLIFGFDPLGREDALKLVGMKYPFRKRSMISYLFLRGRPGKLHARDVEHSCSDRYSVKIHGRWVLDGEFHGEPGKKESLEVRTCEPVPFLVS